MPLLIANALGVIQGISGGISIPNVPTALRQLTVNSAALLTNVLGATSGNFATGVTSSTGDRSAPLRPGDEIICAPGNYAGTFTMRAATAGTGSFSTGFPTNMIGISAQSDGLDNVYFPGTINLNGEWQYVRGRGIKANKVVITAGGCRVSRLRFVNITGACIDLQNNYKYSVIDRNWFQTITGAAVEGNIGASVTSGSNIYNTVFFRNYVFDHYRNGDSEHVIVVLTQQWADTNFSVLENLFRKCIQNKTDEQEILSIKTGQWWIRGNTVIEGDVTLTCRESTDCLFEYNHLGTGALILGRGDGHVYRHNYLEGTSNYIEICSGNAYALDDKGNPNLGEDWCQGNNGQWRGAYKWGRTVAIRDTSLALPQQCRTAQCVATNALAEFNHARIRVGRFYGTVMNSKPTLKVKGVTLRGNRYPAVVVANSIDAGELTEINVNANLPIPTTAIPNPGAAPASGDMVGIFAP